MKTPDTNAGAPRPKHISDEDEPRPDMDHPPPAKSDTATSFDRGTAAADEEARTGTLPGTDDLAPDSIQTGSTQTDSIQTDSIPKEDSDDEDDET